MKNMTYMMIIVFVLSLTVYSCAKKDDAASTTSTSTTSTFTVKGSMYVQNYFAQLKIKELNFGKAISKLNNIAHSSKGR